MASSRGAPAVGTSAAGAEAEPSGRTSPSMTWMTPSAAMISGRSTAALPTVMDPGSRVGEGGSSGRAAQSCPWLSRTSARINACRDATGQAHAAAADRKAPQPLLREPSWGNVLQQRGLQRGTLAWRGGRGGRACCRAAVAGRRRVAGGRSQLHEAARERPAGGRLCKDLVRRRKHRGLCHAAEPAQIGGLQRAEKSG